MKKLLNLILLSITCAFQMNAQLANDLDSTFSSDGVASASSYLTISFYKENQHVGLQSNGKILVSTGVLTSISARYQVHRLLNNGDIDTSFGDNGNIETNVSHGTIGSGHVMFIQPDDKIIIISNGMDGQLKYISMVRYNEDGDIDLNFGTNGQVRSFSSTVSTDSYSIWDGVLHANGKFVFCGTSTIESFPIIGRLNMDGTPDTTFAGNGMYVLPYTDVINSYRTDAVALQADGKAILSFSSQAEGYLARYDTNGVLDPSFGINGLILAQPFYTTFVVLKDLAVQPDGKIIGAANVAGATALGICRYNADGTADSSFSGDGIDTVSFSYPNVSTTALLLQLDGKIVIGGCAADYSNAPNYDGMYTIVRYDNDGEIDSTFCTNGTGISSILLNPYAARMVQQIDDKFILAGIFDSSNVNVVGAARFKNGGATAIAKSTATKTMSLQLYPNPISSTATVSYEIEQNSIVSMWVCDLSGKKVFDIVSNKRVNAGYNRQDITLPDNLANGIYMLNLKAGKQHANIKFIK